MRVARRVTPGLLTALLLAGCGSGEAEDFAVEIKRPAATVYAPLSTVDLAEARLVWSPEGLGWDCFRHYEAAAAWSVPLINTPPIERHAPLEDGKHCFLYDVSGGMAPRIREALADPARLERMAAEARAHVLATATPKAICRYVVGEMLSATRSSKAPSGET